MSLTLPHNFHPTLKVLKGFVLFKVFKRNCYQKEQEPLIFVLTSFSNRFRRLKPSSYKAKNQLLGLHRSNKMMKRYQCSLFIRLDE